MSTAGAGAEALAGAGGGAGAEAGAADGAVLPSWAEGTGLDAPVARALEAKGFVADGKIDAVKLAGSYHGLEQKLGSALPAFDAEKPGEWKGWGKLGVPDSADGYQVTIEGLPDGMAVDEGFLGKAKALAAEHKILPSGLQALVGAYAEEQAARVQALNNELGERRTALDAKLAETFGEDMAARTARAQAAARELFGVGLGRGFDDHDQVTLDKLNEALGDPGIVLVFDKIAALMGEDKLVDARAGAAAVTTPEGAASKIDALRADDEFQKAYQDKSHPGHERAVKEMLDLYAQKRGGKAA